MNAVIPPADVVPAATKAMVVKQAGHMSVSLNQGDESAALP
jgi:hypothetical protein